MDFNYSTTLFVNPKTKQPIEFSMRPCSERAILKPLIEHGGGIINYRDTNDCWRLCAAGSIVSRKNIIQSSFIHECIKENQLLDPAAFYFKLEEVNKSDIDDEFFKDDPLPNSSSINSKTFRKGYSYNEKLKMVKYICEKKLHDQIGGNTLWKRMEKLKILKGRSWQSMKEHFRKKILKDIHAYNLSNEDIARFNIKENFVGVRNRFGPVSQENKRIKLEEEEEDSSDEEPKTKGKSVIGPSRFGQQSLKKPKLELRESSDEELLNEEEKDCDTSDSNGEKNHHDFETPQASPAPVRKKHLAPKSQVYVQTPKCSDVKTESEIKNLKVVLTDIASSPSRLKSSTSPPIIDLESKSSKSPKVTELEESSTVKSSRTDQTNDTQESAIKSIQTVLEVVDHTENGNLSSPDVIDNSLETATVLKPNVKSKNLTEDYSSKKRSELKKYCWTYMNKIKALAC